VGPDLGSSLFASSTTHFEKILPKITFFKLIQIFHGGHFVSQAAMG